MWQALIVMRCMKPPTMSLCHSDSRVSHEAGEYRLSLLAKLPSELLEAIFLEFVRDGRDSPVVLAHVCRLWRAIVYEMGSVWRHVDLQFPDQAKHHLINSQWQPLDVVWLNRSYGPGAHQNDCRQWLWPYSHRFATLCLTHTSKTLSNIFGSMSPFLPELVDLTAMGQDISMNLRVPVRIQSSMPRLQSLSLS